MMDLKLAFMEISVIWFIKCYLNIEFITFIKFNLNFNLNILLIHNHLIVKY